MIRKRRHSPAFVLVDVLIALSIIASLAIVLSSAVYRQRNAEAALTDSRAALYLAEHALLNLQHNQPLPAIDRDSKLRILPAAGGVAPTGFAWAEARSTVHGHERSLLGIVPANAIPVDGATR